MMKKILICTFLLLCMADLFADEFEKNYGNGVVHIQADSIDFLQFYSSPNGEVIHSLSIIRSTAPLSKTMITFDTLIDSVPGWFATEYFITHGEYARIDIRALDSANGFYRSTLRDSSNRELWIKKQKHVSFLNWLGFYQTVASIELNDGDLILYETPDVKSKSMNYTPMVNPDDPNALRAMEIKGYWMRVEFDAPTKDPHVPWRTYTGWIKWRNEKQPLIRYNLMGC